MAEVPRPILLDYLNDALPADQAAAVERAVRADPALQAEIDRLRIEADQSEHTVGGIWRRERLSCPTRETLASHLQDVLPPEQSEYIRFHINDVACPFCQANLDDLTRLHAEPVATRSARWKRIVDSSAGVLRKGGR